MENENTAESAQQRQKENLPDSLYILPLRNGLLFPGIMSPITVVNPTDIEVVNAAMNRGEIGLLLMKDNLPRKAADIDIGKITPDDLNKIMQGKFDEVSDEMGKIIDIASGELIVDGKQFYKVGVVAKIVKRINMPSGGVSLLLSVIRRMYVMHFYSTGDLYSASVGYFDSEFGQGTPQFQLQAYTRVLNHKMNELIASSQQVGDDVKMNLANITNPGLLCDYIANNLDLDAAEQQDILETIDISSRVQKVLRFLEKEKAISEMQSRIENSVRMMVEKEQRDYILREEMKAIQKELGNGAPAPEEIDDAAIKMRPGGAKFLKLKKQFQETPMNDEAKEAIKTELERMSRMDPYAHDYSLIEQYVETVLSLPWKSDCSAPCTIEQAKKILDRDHYGLDDVKQRILEFIAVRILNNDSKGSIICLVGPPGVGKTSIGLSIARALNKKCFRFSVGGIRDEAEIKGHRRTYLGAMPGKIIQGLKITGTQDPVFLIDEIDKLQQSSNQGDPASALLEVLDPEQNKSFRDHFIDVPFDVSKVLFVVTANDKHAIPGPLLDRMEVIELSGYTAYEKLQIAKNYLVPKCRKLNGLSASDVKISPAMLMEIAEGWAREPGVRNLEKSLSRICRKIALEKLTAGEAFKPVTLSKKNIVKYLDSPRFTDDDIVRADRPGMSIGLAYNGYGGTTLAIESRETQGKGELKLTGQLGDVMKESANIAFSYLRSSASELGLDPAWFETHNVHIHFPDGATPKDGPSAGAAICCALYSLITGKLICPLLAMTGELSLTGRVMEIGGLKEKTLAVGRNRFKQVIIPKANVKDLKKFDAEITRGLTFYAVSDIGQVLSIAFTTDRTPGNAEAVDIYRFED